MQAIYTAPARCECPHDCRKPATIHTDKHTVFGSRIWCEDCFEDHRHVVGAGIQTRAARAARDRASAAKALASCDWYGTEAGR